MTADPAEVVVVVGASGDFSASVVDRQERFVHLVPPGSAIASVVREDVDELHTVELHDPEVQAAFASALLAPLPVVAVWNSAGAPSEEAAQLARLLGVTLVQAPAPAGRVTGHGR